MALPRDEKGELYVCAWCRRDSVCAECPGNITHLRLGEHGVERINESEHWKAYAKKYIFDVQKFAGKPGKDTQAALDEMYNLGHKHGQVIGLMNALRVDGADGAYNKGYVDGYLDGLRDKKRKFDLQKFADDDYHNVYPHDETWDEEDERRWEAYCREKRAREQYFRRRPWWEEQMADAGMSLHDFE